MRTAVVIHGASNRSEEEFTTRVRGLQTALGDDWQLSPIWWGSAGVDLDLVRAGIPYVLPPKPGFFLADEPAIGPAELTGPTVAEAEADTEATRALAPPGWDHLVWHARRLLLSNVTGIMADVLMYWHNREQIERTVLQKIRAANSGSVDVIAHSLGAIITLDLVLSNQLSVNRLVTFGTPPAGIHVLDPTRNPQVAPFQPGTPLNITAIQRWINLWSHWDPIALVAGRVFSANGSDVEDREAKFPGDTPIGRAHSAYWDSADLVTAVRDAWG